jgi:glycosyltransferase involved in cell wall biosynthesis
MLVGVNSPTKGGDKTAEIVTELNRELRNRKVRYIYIGTAPKDSAANGDVEIPEGTPSDELRSYMSASDLLIYCSPADNLPNLIIEGQSVGLPVLAWDIGGISETFLNGATGFLVEPHLGILIRKAIEIINNRQLLRDMPTNSLEFVNSKFGSKKISDLYLNVYDRILAR